MNQEQDEQVHIYPVESHLRKLLEGKKVHSPVLNQDVTTTKCSKLNTSKNCLTHVSHLILYLQKSLQKQSSSGLNN